MMLVLRNKVVKGIVQLTRWLMNSLYYDTNFSTFNNHYFDQLPDRIWLKQCLLPRLIALKNLNILFVGCAPYTTSIVDTLDIYTHLTTVDNKFRNIIWGGTNHILIDIQKIDLVIAPNSLDFVLLNGIFGYGVDTLEEQIKTFNAIHKIMKPDGILLLGWNKGAYQSHLSKVHTLLFDETGFHGLPNRTVFQSSEHVYDFLKKI